MRYRYDTAIHLLRGKVFSDGEGGGGNEGSRKKKKKIIMEKKKSRVIQHADPLQSLLLSQENKYTGELPSAFSPSTDLLLRDDLSI